MPRAAHLCAARRAGVDPARGRGSGAHRPREVGSWRCCGPGGSLYVVVPGRCVAGNAQDAHDARMVESLVHVQPFAHMPA
ncbi:hypothetical protein C7S14_1962 [Burkholderia cepacia]|nr:hypothetical protein C7S14_1962 [Burkholderia cepacia]